MSDEGFISRWSRRKSEARTEAPKEEPKAPEPSSEAGPPAPSPEPLPPVESLTPDSDFAPFMKPEVDADTKRKAVKMLFQDPRYNVMDGLDVYIDDYSKPDPLPEGWLEKMTQMARLGEHVDPDRVKPEPDRENAEKTARENHRLAAEAAENSEIEQQVARSDVSVSADTPDAVSQPGKVGQSRPDG